MPEVTISRRAGTLPQKRRDQIKPGEVFAKVIDGKPSKKYYAALGHNGKFLSVNLTNGELASAVKLDAPVVIVGKWKLGTIKEMDQAKWRPTTRAAVKNGEMFVAKGKERRSLYAHLGRLTNAKFCSFDVGGPVENYATTDNGARNVLVVGKFKIDVELSA